MKVGWQTKSLGDVAKVGAGNSAPQGDVHFKDGEYPFFRTSDAGKIRFGDIYEASDNLNEQGVKGLRLFPRGTILFPKSGASTFLNHRVILGVDGYVSSHLAAIVADKSQVHERFLLYFLTTISAQDLVQDHSYPSLNLPIISGIQLPCPSLSEQQRIVTILDQAFDGIATATANAEKNLANARGLFDVHFASLFNSENKNWDRKTLGDVCSLYQGIAINAKTKHALVEKSELPLLRIKDLKNNSVEQYINPNNYPKNALVNEDDIIYTRTGSLGLVFRGRRGVLHNNSFKVVPNDSLSKDYLFLWLQNPVFKSKIMDLALRAAQPDITHAIFKMQDISIPSLTEQDDIVKKLNELAVETQRLENIYKQKLEALEALKKSILHQAFTGQLN